MMTNCFELADRKHDRITESRGNFIKSSVVTMEVLRTNADIILAMLEAFLYDPLLSWTVSSELRNSVVKVADAAGECWSIRSKCR
jgi:FKBP12-rapamycin complex-associated protein